MSSQSNVAASTERERLDEFLEVEEVHAAASPRIPAPYRTFVDNVGISETLDADLAAWQRLHLRPRALTDVGAVDTSLELLGTGLRAPILTAPYIGPSFVHADGEIELAAGTANAGSIMVLSMNSSRTPEQVGAVARGRYWQQLYWIRDRGRFRAIVERAAESGATALCLTVDLPVRPSFSAAMRDAAAGMAELTDAEPRHAMFRRREQPDAVPGSGFPDATVTWDDLAWLRGLTDLPLVLKGVIRPEDAVLAKEHGAAAVIVSNHGGQAMRSSQPVAEALPRVSDAVGGELVVLADSGIRSGTDVLRAIALGARAVLIGRPTLWGLTVGGAAGVERVHRLLAEQLTTAMALAGCTRLADVDGSVLG